MNDQKDEGGLPPAQEVVLDAHGERILPATTIGTPVPLGSGLVRAWRIQVNTTIAHHHRRLAEASEARDVASTRAIDAQIALQRAVERLRNTEEYLAEDRADFEAEREAARYRREEIRLQAETKRLVAEIELTRKKHELMGVKEPHDQGKFTKFADIIETIRTLEDLDEFMRQQIEQVGRSTLPADDKVEKVETIRTLCRNRAELIEQGGDRA